MKSLALGNGLTETRSFDPRYFPTAIEVPGRLDWLYATDDVGNVTAITDEIIPANSRTYGYQDFAYFLTQGDGPWGTRSWSYDRIGNRLSETRNGVTDTYSYPGNGAAGNNPKLASIALGAGGTKTYTYDLEGQMKQVTTAGSPLDLTSNDFGQVSKLDGVGTFPRTTLSYDGRGYLRLSKYEPVSGTNDTLTPNYTSDGRLLHHQRTQTGSTTTLHNYLLYFAGRPVAIYEVDKSGSTVTRTEITYLTTDHLGTPVLATSATGVQTWQGGFEAFGDDYSGAQTAGVFPRFPGQWEDQTWENTGLPSGLHYNLHRWYESGTGRYASADRAFLLSAVRPYIYGSSRPTRHIDPLGLADAPPQPGPSVPPSDPSFKSGPWGDRPDPDCCDKQKVELREKRARDIAEEIRERGYVSSPPPAGLAGDVRGYIQGALNPIPGREGWFVFEPLDPHFEPHCGTVGDPCLRYCCRVHEWFHYTDRRPFHMSWDYNVFSEVPGHKWEAGCLRTFF